MQHVGEPAKVEQTQQTCFLCALDSRPCAVPQLEGRITAAYERTLNGEIVPCIIVDMGTCFALLLLSPYYHGIVKELAARGDTIRTLTLRVYHLQTATSAGAYRGRPLYRYQANSYTLAVLEPDVLLNITDLNQAEYCARQYLLSRLVPSTQSAATLRGNLVHTCFKELLKEHDRGELMNGHAVQGQETPLATLQRYLEQALERSSIELALANVPVEAMRASVIPHLESLATWFQNQSATLWDMPTAYMDGQADGDGRQQHENMVRAETFLLAPEIGLKGRLDLLWQQTGRQRLLELKTGGGVGSLPKRNHRWQVLGYHALLTVRRDSKMKKALATLLYSGTPGEAQAHGISFSVRELQRVNETRNILVLSSVSGTPPAPPGPARCTKCAMLQQCEQVSSLLNWQPPEPNTRLQSQDEDVPEQETSPLPFQFAYTAEDRAFFSKYYQLLQVEGRESEQQQALLWKTSLAERIERGSAISDLQPLGKAEPTGEGEWEQEFLCSNTSELREGDEILLSDGNPITGEVVTGTIKQMSAERVRVWSPELIARPSLIDRYESSIVHVRTVQNLMRWLQGDPHLRQLVTGTVRPRFNRIAVPHGIDFNAEQNLAVERALQMQDYLLVHGPPGTGKTAVIAEIVKRLCQQGQRVLLAAFTNQAVDNMLTRLDKEGFHDYVRLGHDRSVHASVQERLLKQLARSQQNDNLDSSGATHSSMVGAPLAHPAWGAGNALPDVRGAQQSTVRDILQKTPVVASTTATWSSEKYVPQSCNGAANTVNDLPLQFDVAIIDEASQLTIPAILGALRFARRFILVGDEKQLPPLVLSKEAAAHGLAESLFSYLKRLDNDYTKDKQVECSACVPLRVQYRMNRWISHFASKVFYEGKVEAAATVAQRVLDIAITGAQLATEVPSITQAIQPKHPLVFLDVRGKGEGEGLKMSNAETRVVRAIVQGLLARGIAQKDIGIIAPYRAQVANLRRHLFNADEASGWQALTSATPISIDTVDRFQGGERLVIIMSFATPHVPAVESQLREFLTNPNRLNVALTRAQRKLIVVGCVPALEGLPYFQRLLAYCRSMNTVITYPE